jgi:hypothetical protein
MGVLLLLVVLRPQGSDADEPALDRRGGGPTDDWTSLGVAGALSGAGLHRLARAMDR